MGPHLGPAAWNGASHGNAGCRPNPRPATPAPAHLLPRGVAGLIACVDRAMRNLTLRGLRLVPEYGLRLPLRRCAGLAAARHHVADHRPQGDHMHVSLSLPRLLPGLPSLGWAHRRPAQPPRRPTRRLNGPISSRPGLRAWRGADAGPGQLATAPAGRRGAGAWHGLGGGADRGGGGRCAAPAGHRAATGPAGLRAARGPSARLAACRAQGPAPAMRTQAPRPGPRRSCDRGRTASAWPRSDRRSPSARGPRDRGPVPGRTWCGHHRSA